MQFHFQQALRALVLVAFFAMIAKLHLSGDITKFINPKYEMLSQSAMVLFFFLFLIQLTRVWSAKEEHDHHNCSHDDHHCTHDHGSSPFSIKKFISYAILVTPILTGFILPPKVLDASIASKKGAMVILSSQQQAVQEEKSQSEVSIVSDEEFDQSLEGDVLPPIHEAAEPITLGETISEEEHEKLLNKLRSSSTIEMDDYVYNSYYEEISRDLGQYSGRKIKVNGFVYKEEGFAENQLVLARFLVTHCVADASIIGFLTEFPEAADIDVDTWLEAEAVLDITNYNGVEMPVLKITNWKEISEPKEPYLYPINIKLL